MKSWFLDFANKYDEIPLCAHIKNEEYKNRLKEFLIFFNQPDQYGTSYCDFMIDHGLNHAQNLWIIANRIYCDNYEQLKNLTEMEVFCLCHAIWLHDIGMSTNLGQIRDNEIEIKEYIKQNITRDIEEKEYFKNLHTCEFVRFHHSLLSYFFIVNKHEHLGNIKDNHRLLREIIGTICYYHSSKTILGENQQCINSEKEFHFTEILEDSGKDIKTFTISEKEQNQTVNVLFLAALLRFIDACDQTKKRLKSSDAQKAIYNQNLTEISEIHNDITTELNNKLSSSVEDENIKLLWELLNNLYKNTELIEKYIDFKNKCENNANLNGLIPKIDKYHGLSITTPSHFKYKESIEDIFFKDGKIVIVKGTDKAIDKDINRFKNELIDELNTCYPYLNTENDETNRNISLSYNPNDDRLFDVVENFTDDYEVQPSSMRNFKDNHSNIDKEDTIINSTENDWWKKYEHMLDAMGHVTEKYEKKIFIRGDEIFNNIDSSLKTEGINTILLLAHMGVGKSALAYHLPSKLGDFISLGPHFCSSKIEDSCQPNSIIKSIIYHLSKKNNKYRDKVTELGEPDWTRKPLHLFQDYIKKPLENIADNKYVYIIDGLDEAFDEEEYYILDFLGTIIPDLPDSFTFIITSRPDNEIKDIMNVSKLKFFDLEQESKENLEDLKNYIHHRINEMKLEQEDLVKLIISKAEGNFQYAELALDFIKDYLYSIDFDNFDLPKGLPGLYNLMFERRFAKHSILYDSVKPLLECLVAAPSPLPKPILLESSGLSEDNMINMITVLSQFLNSYESDEVFYYRLFHSSIIEWLTKSQTSIRFRISNNRGHKKLSDICYNEYKDKFENMSEYSLNNILLHLEKSGDTDKIYEVMTDLKYIEKICVLSNIYNLIKKYASILSNNETKFDNSQKNEIKYILEFIKKHAHSINKRPNLLYQKIINYALPESIIYKSAENLIKIDNNPWLHYLNPKQTIASQTFTEHGIKVNSIAVTPDNQTLFAVGRNPNIDMWKIEDGNYCSIDDSDGNNGECVQDSSKFINKIVAESNQYVITGNNGGGITRWDVVNKKKVLQSDLDGVQISALAITNDGNFIISANLKGYLSLWNSDLDCIYNCILDDPRHIKTIAITNDGSTVFTGDSKGYVTKWDLKNFNIIFNKSILIHYKEINDIQLNDKYGFSVGADGRIIKWSINDINKNEVIGEIKKGNNVINSLALWPDNEYIFCGDNNNEITVWKIDSNKNLFSLSDHSNNIKTLIATSKYGLFSGSSDGTVKQFELGKNLEKVKLGIKKHYGKISHIKISPDNNYAVSTCNDDLDNDIKIWDINNGNLKFSFDKHKKLIKSIDISNNSEYIISTDIFGLTRKWSIQDGSSYLIDANIAPIRCAALSLDNKSILCGTNDNAILCLDVEKGERVRVLENSPVPLNSYKFKEVNYSQSRICQYNNQSVMVEHIIFWDDSSVITVGSDNIIRLINLEDGDYIADNSKYCNPNIDISSIHRFADTNLLITGCPRGISVWEVNCDYNNCSISPVPIKLSDNEEINDDIKSPIISIVPSNNYAIILSSYGFLYKFDPNEIKLTSFSRQKRSTHKSKTTSIAISSNGQFMASCSHDKTLLLWDLKDEDIIAYFDAEDELESCAIAEDDNSNIKVVCGGKGGYIYILELKNNPRANKKTSLMTEMEHCDELKLPENESETVEFKSSLLYDYKNKTKNSNLEFSCLRSIVAFLNSKGGKLYIGVSDDGNILGLENDLNLCKRKNIDGFKLHLDDSISNHLSKTVHSCLRIEIQSIEERDICIITVEPSENPVYYDKNSFFIRRSASTIELKGEDLVKYINTKFKN